MAAYIDGDYRTWADEHLAVIVMIETIQAVEQAEAILAVDGVVGCFIGPNDLALSMGLTQRIWGQAPSTRRRCCTCSPPRKSYRQSCRQALF